MNTLKTPPSTFSKHVFFYFDQKSVPGLKKITNINVNVFCLAYCGSTQCSQPVWGSCIPVHPLFLLQESYKQCYFSLILQIFTGAVGKK